MKKVMAVWGAAALVTAGFAKAPGIANKISAPIRATMSTAATRPLYFEQCRRAGVDRVFLTCSYFWRQPPAEQEASLKILKENLAAYAAAGFETAVWISGLGHGGALAHDSARAAASGFQRIVGLYSGGSAEDSFCPLDPGFRAAYIGAATRLAAAGVPMLMIDDDLRLSLHGAAAHGCACPRHLAEFNRRARARGASDRDWRREELAKTLFTGKPNALRRVWLESQGDSLRDFCRDLRAAVDAVNPKMRLGHCAVLTTWDVEGADSFEMARLLAGGTRPFVRFIGAPYWRDGKAFNALSLAGIVGAERMQAAWAEAAPDIEVFAEGDTYPRPRTNPACAASYLEGFSQVLEAEGRMNGILKYVFSYVAPPDYEPGYVRVTEAFAPLRAELRREFAGKETAGLYVFEAMRKTADADRTGLDARALVTRWVPDAVNFLAGLSVPVSFTRTPHTKAAVVFGENARHLDATVEGLPLILDRRAARILKERGAEPPAGRCFVCDFDAATVDMADSALRSYERQAQIFDAVRRLTGAPAPAALLKQPGAYLLCRKNAAGEMTVGIWNFGSDIVLADEVRLDGAYGSVRFFGGATGRLDGDKVSLDRPVHPFAFAGFTVSRGGPAEAKTGD